MSSVPFVGNIWVSYLEIIQIFRQQMNNKQTINYVNGNPIFGINAADDLLAVPNLQLWAIKCVIGA